MTSIRRVSVRCISVGWIRTFIRLAALTAALLIGADDADVRPADGWGFSGVAFSSLVTAAAAETAITPQAQTAPMSTGAGSPTYPGGSLSGLFRGGGLIGGFAAGFLGSGVLGLLFGRGLFGELGGAASYFGLLCQLALLLTLCWLIWTRWHGGEATKAAARSPRQLAEAYLRSRDDLHPAPSAFVGEATDSERQPHAQSSSFTDARSDCG